MSQQAIVTDMDMERLTKVIEMYQGHKAVETLESKLMHAKVIDQYETPPDLVTMNTTIRCAYKEDNHVGGNTLTIVYPKGSLLEYGRISILAPLGLALLGTRQGQSVEWRGHDGVKRSLTVSEILYQPEAHEDWDK